MMIFGDMVIGGNGGNFPVEKYGGSEMVEERYLGSSVLQQTGDDNR